MEAVACCVCVWCVCVCVCVSCQMSSAIQRWTLTDQQWKQVWRAVVMLDEVLCQVCVCVLALSGCRQKTHKEAFLTKIQNAVARMHDMSLRDNFDG